MVTTSPQMLTLYDVAKVLGIAYATARQRALDGDLPARKIGALWRIDPERFEEYRRAQSPGGNSPNV